MSENQDHPNEVSWEESNRNENTEGSSSSKVETFEVEQQGDKGQVFKCTRSTYIFAACAALNSCNLGYDIGVNTGAAMRLQNSLTLSDLQVEMFMGSLNLFAMIGALGSHFASDRLGRRGAFLVAAIGFIVGIMITCSAQRYATLMAGRLFVGLGLGFGLAVDPVYIAEISPAAHRGRLVTWSEVGINIGLVLGFASGLLFTDVPDNSAWRGMFALGMILPSVLIFLICFVMPESPRWLVQRDRELEAKEVLKRVYPSDWDIDSVVADIKASIERDTEAEHAVGWDVILWPSPAFKRMLLVGIGTAILQQANGIEAVQYFLVYILNQSGLESNLTITWVLIGLGLVKLLFVVIAGKLFDTTGRRFLMLLSCAGICLSTIVLAINFSLEGSTGVAIFCLALYLAFFSLGLGPGCWLITSEIFSTTIRAKAMSLASFFNRVMAMLMNSTFLSVANAISYGGFFILLSLVSLISAAFFYVLLPETKGKTLEDMTLHLAQITGDQSILEADQRLRAQRASNPAPQPNSGRPYVPAAVAAGTMS